MLLTPLADFLAKGKAGKLTTASDAICHGLLREYQQGWFEREWRVWGWAWLKADFCLFPTRTIPGARSLVMPANSRFLAR
jgi:hypothetical protein